MISILISTYNYDCYRLVGSLHDLCEASGVEYEIIVDDDCSRDKLSQIACVKVREMSHVIYVQNAENIGQAANRNRLAEQASGEWLIFIDSDARVDNPDFIRNYLDAQGKADVVVGGISTPMLQPYEVVNRCITADLGKPHSSFVVNRTLRYKYERNADSTRSAGCRSKRPYDQFSTFNFMVRRDVFLNVRFDEDCRQYGYEDFLFGIELERRGITILHIDNPLTHMGIDTNAQFLLKTETALHTLTTLPHEKCQSSRLVQCARKLGSLHLQGVARTAYKMLRRPFRHNLLGVHPSLFVFSLYKLGYFLCLEQEKNVPLQTENKTDL